ncbi:MULTISPECIES: hypothetical protein [Streptomyces]|uniref:Uncharacterized protein n=1 Tax=Streptomyces demainii TaxID=588122 RepID=A0ABT9KHD9_9ACTN|nr:hypothetical protein [Streptomyces demainii]MDP9607814.1 hypothetical protein [Streptomyces demainii]
MLSLLLALAMVFTGLCADYVLAFQAGVTPALHEVEDTTSQLS